MGNRVTEEVVEYEIMGKKRNGRGEIKFIKKRKQSATQLFTVQRRRYANISSFRTGG
jgi:hypothetical protein